MTALAILKQMRSDTPEKEILKHQLKTTLNEMTSLDLSLLSSANRSDQLTLKDLAHLCEALEDNVTLSGLDLSNHLLGDDGANLLGLMLSKNRALTTVCIAGNGITDKGIKLLLTGLRDNHTLMSLGREENNIVNFLPNFEEADAQFGKINWQKLELDSGRQLNHSWEIGNCIGLKAISALDRYLVRNRWTLAHELLQDARDQIQNKSSPLSVFSILKKMRAFPTYPHLKIQLDKALKNKIHLDLSASTLSHVLWGEEGGLPRLILQDLKNLVHALNNHPTLKFLELQDNQLGEPAQALLADLLNCNPALTSLYIAGNNLGPMTMTLMDAIYHHQALLHLDASETYYYAESEKIKDNPHSLPHNIFYHYESMEASLKKKSQQLYKGVNLSSRWADLAVEKEDILKIEQTLCRNRKTWLKLKLQAAKTNHELALKATTDEAIKIVYTHSAWGAMGGLGLGAFSAMAGLAAWPVVVPATITGVIVGGMHALLSPTPRPPQALKRFVEVLESPPVLVNITPASTQPELVTDAKTEQANVSSKVKRLSR